MRQEEEPPERPQQAERLGQQESHVGIPVESKLNVNQ